jgi:mevalonate kinase
MNDNHAQLVAMTVSSAALDRLAEAARAAGALGAKLSGAGRGGNLIALVTERERGGGVRCTYRRRSRAPVSQRRWLR